MAFKDIHASWKIAIFSNAISLGPKNPTTNKISDIDVIIILITSNIWDRVY